MMGHAVSGTAFGEQSQPAAILELIVPFPGGLSFAKWAIIIVSSFHLGGTESEGVYIV